MNPTLSHVIWISGRLAPALALCLVLAVSREASAQSGWSKPPAEVLEVLHAPDLPVTSLDPSGRTLALLERVLYQPLADLAAPMHRLAGLRVNPRTTSMHAEPGYASLTLQRLSDGRRIPVPAASSGRLLRLRWSHDGERFAFTSRVDDGVELWIGETDTGAARRMEGLRIHPLFGLDAVFLPDGRSLLAKTVPAERGPAPAMPEIPDGPNVSETSGGRATSTYEARDVLASGHDEALFAHFAASQLVRIDAGSGPTGDFGATPLGEPGIITRAEPSPDGSLILVERIRRPFSRHHAWWRFPRDVELLDRGGRTVQVLARLPLADAVPIHGVPEGPRAHAWRPTAAATLTWIEALDGGDWAREVPHRDRVLAQAIGTDEAPREIHRAVHRVEGLSWGDTDDLLIVEEHERARRWRHAWALHPGDPAVAPVKIVDVSRNDRYADPGRPVQRDLPGGHSAIVQRDGSIFLRGSGASPEGDRPFLDRLDPATGRSERLFRSATGALERVEELIEGDPDRLLVRSEAPLLPPNLVELRHRGRIAATGPGEGRIRWSRRAITNFADPAPVLRGIGKRIVTFERGDGVPLSFTLYTPPGWDGTTRLPVVVHAYPLEYSDPATAGQIAGSESTFTRILGSSHLFLLLSGYAVLHDVRMPVIGDPDTAYDTFVEQLVSSASAALAKAAELGVADPDRAGVMGHSHGGLMAATLLAHSDLFRAGIARSGAYNHTMRPFGFQSERRTLWQAMDTYVKLSPVMHAPSIDEPLLIIHGETDQNPGTVPLQSEKLYDAIRGTGGTARLVMLPHELHGYVSREAVEHVLAEQLAWFDRFVKTAPPRPASPRVAGDPADGSRRGGPASVPAEGATTSGR